MVPRFTLSAIGTYFLSAVAIVALLGTRPALGDDTPPKSVGGTREVKVDPKTGNATRGTGAEREIRVTGRVYDQNGVPAKDYEVVVRHSSLGYTRRDLEATIRGGEFDFWVPIGGSDWFSLSLFVSSADGKQIAQHVIQQFELRQAAIEGVELKLAETDRTVRVTVTKDGKPVKGAHVTAELPWRKPPQADTSDDGVAVYHLMHDDAISQLTAWTDDFQIGGYALYRQPYRDRLGSEFTIELEACRDQKIRLVSAADGTPVSDTQFVLIVGTSAPNYNFAGTPDTLPKARMTTDDRGEAIYRWFPDWERHRSYIEMNDSHWVVDTSDDGTIDDADGTMVVKLKPRAARKWLLGRIDSARNHVTNFLVVAQTFQGESEGRSDIRYAFTGDNGVFAVDCLPGATYCVYVMDQNYVSDTIDLIPFDPGTGKSTRAMLTLSEGEPVEIRATSGPHREPLRRQWINMRTPHDYSWVENGKTRHGGGGKQWGAYTNNEGIVRTRALAGSEFEASVYAGARRAREKVTVKSDAVTTIDLHLPIADEREVKGKLILPPNLQAKLLGATIEAGAIDGKSDERITVKADRDGNFSFKTKATQVGVFAYTSDGKAAVLAKPRRIDAPLELQLKPTAALHGRLLGPDDQPIARHAVRTTVFVKADHAGVNNLFSTIFNAKTFETTTDGEGNYTLSGLPSEVKMTVRADALDGSRDEEYLEGFYLKVGEDRPPLVSHLGSIEE